MTSFYSRDLLPRRCGLLHFAISRNFFPKLWSWKQNHEHVKHRMKKVPKIDAHLHGFMCKMSNMSAFISSVNLFVKSVSHLNVDTSANICYWWCDLCDSRMRPALSSPLQMTIWMSSAVSPERTVQNVYEHLEDNTPARVTVWRRMVNMFWLRLQLYCCRVVRNTLQIKAWFTSFGRSSVLSHAVRQQHIRS